MCGSGFPSATVSLDIAVGSCSTRPNSPAHLPKHKLQNCRPKRWGKNTNNIKHNLSRPIK